MRRTPSDYGISQQDWDAAKHEARSAMIERARLRRMIYYSDLVKKIFSVAFDYHDVRLNSLLADISTEEDTAGRGLLTAVVVHKTGEQKDRPGSGFYDLAATLDRNTSDKDRCWTNEVRRVHEYWSSQPQ